jgi:catechol 2,3-dioxygenase-like lactoylglutathione lyase family enzyme
MALRQPVFVYLGVVAWNRGKSMLDHLSLTVADLGRSLRFYTAAFAPLSIVPLVELSAAQTGTEAYAGFGAAGTSRAFFWIGTGARRGGSVHVAFAAQTRAQVDAFHHAALAAGGQDNGPPGIRAHYHPDYYGAFVLDPDGHNIEAVCRTPG